MSNEQWKEISESDGRYLVSEFGKVYSNISDKELKISTMNNGYEVVGLSMNGQKRMYLVHRLVAREFCAGYAENLDVNHKNAVRNDNRAVNLEWMTRKDNIRDCIKRGTFDVKAAHSVAHVKRRRPVAQYDKDGTLLRTFESARRAYEYIGTHENNISRACRGVRKTCKGYVWKYID